MPSARPWTAYWSWIPDGSLIIAACGRDKIAIGACVGAGAGVGGDVWPAAPAADVARIAATTNDKRRLDGSRSARVTAPPFLHSASAA
jgi:hypothetical protein